MVVKICATLFLGTPTSYSKQCSESTKARRGGCGQHAHTNGSKPFIKTAHEMADANDGIMPSIPELIKKTHTRADGTFVDKYAEKVVDEVYNIVNQMSSSDTVDPDLNNEDESTVTMAKTNLLNKVFYEHVPANNGYQFGLCGTQFHHGETSASGYSPHQLHSDTEFANDLF